MRLGLAFGPDVPARGCTTCDALDSWIPRCVRGNRGGVNRAILHHGETPWQFWLVADPPGRNIRVRLGGLVVNYSPFSVKTWSANATLVGRSTRRPALPW